MRIISIIPEYFSFPLWEQRLGKNIDPETLPIPKELSIKLEIWQKKFQSILNMEDPSSSSFKTLEEEKNFIDEGYYLARELKQELGDSYVIEYYPIHHRDFIYSKREQIIVYL